MLPMKKKVIKRVKDKKGSGRKGMAEGLSAEVSELVHSLAAEADEIGEEWTAAAEPELASPKGERKQKLRKQKSAKQSKKQKGKEGNASVEGEAEDEELRRARLAKAANEEAEILGGSSDAEISESIDGDDAEQPKPSKKAKADIEYSKEASKPSNAKAKGKHALEDPQGKGRKDAPPTQALEESRKKDVPPTQQTQESRKKDGQVFLSGLPFSVDEADVRKDFGKFGEITRFYFHRDATGRPAGTACIFYKTQELADKVMLLDGIEYKGRAIQVKRRGPRQSGGKRTKAAKAAWDRMPEWKAGQVSKKKKKKTKGESSA